MLGLLMMVRGRLFKISFCPTGKQLIRLEEGDQQRLIPYNNLPLHACTRSPTIHWQYTYPIHRQ